MRHGHEFTDYLEEQHTKNFPKASSSVFPRMDRLTICACSKAIEIVAKSLPHITRLRVGLTPSSSPPNSHRSLSHSVFTLSHLTSLQLTGFTLDDATLASFAKFAELRALKVSGTIGTGVDSMRIFGRALARTGVRALALSRCLPPVATAMSGDECSWIECIDALLGEVQLAFLQVRLAEPDAADLRAFDSEMKHLRRRRPSNPISFVVNGSSHCCVNGVFFRSGKHRTHDD